MAGSRDQRERPDYPSPDSGKVSEVPSVGKSLISLTGDGRVLSGLLPYQI